MSWKLFQWGLVSKFQRISKHSCPRFRPYDHLNRKLEWHRMGFQRVFSSKMAAINTHKFIQDLSSTVYLEFRSNPNEGIYTLVVVQTQQIKTIERRVASRTLLISLCYLGPDCQNILAK